MEVQNSVKVERLLVYRVTKDKAANVCRIMEGQGILPAAGTGYVRPTPRPPLKPAELLRRARRLAMPPPQQPRQDTPPPPLRRQVKK